VIKEDETGGTRWTTDFRNKFNSSGRRPSSRLEDNVILMDLQETYKDMFYIGFMILPKC
jgi:hypothetical protein